jgi:4-hydroxythreonine-4-phosphate dehydrogenase
MTVLAPDSTDQRTPALVIVADDLTGAADCAVVCVKRGLDAVVVLAPDAPAQGVDVLAIDADTRALHPEAAAEKTARVLSSLGQGKDFLVFKKIDSTLRGHIGVELAAMSARRRTVPDSIVVLAPAFPALGRTTVDGYHFLWGRPLEETGPWRDEDRTGRAFLPRMASDAGLRTELLPLGRVREDDAALLAAMKQLAAKCDVIACDAETEDDLAALARASFQLGRAIWAGSAGLVGHLVDVAGLTGSQPRHTFAATAGAQVFVVGSRSAVSRRQAASFAALDDVEMIDVDPTSSADELDIIDFKGRFSSALDTGKAVLIWQAGEEPPAKTARSRPCGDLAMQIARYRSRIGALFATGGETARCLLEAFGVQALCLIDEVEPGIALSMAVGRPELAIVTKAGAFGNDASMAVSHAALSHAAAVSRNPAADQRRAGA